MREIRTRIQAKSLYRLSICLYRNAHVEVISFDILIGPKTAAYCLLILFTAWCMRSIRDSQVFKVGGSWGMHNGSSSL